MNNFKRSQKRLADQISEQDPIYAAIRKELCGVDRVTTEVIERCRRIYEQMRKARRSE